MGFFGQCGLGRLQLCINKIMCTEYVCHCTVILHVLLCTALCVVHSFRESVSTTMIISAYQYMGTNVRVTEARKS